MRIFFIVAVVLCYLNFASAGAASSTGDQTASTNQCNLICQDVGQLTNTFCSSKIITVDYSRTGLTVSKLQETGVKSCSSLV
jgi:hypothetical protein